MITPAFIDQLRCPSCGSSLTVEHASPTPDPKSPGIRDGVLACDCCRYPIIDGILALQQGATFPDRLRDGAVQAVLRADRHSALDCALRASDLLRRGPLATAAARVLSPVSRRLAERYGQRVDAGVVLDDGLSFEELALALRPRGFAHYLIQRYANPSLHAAIPAMLLLGGLRAAGRRPSIIDLGAGAGHASALLATLIPGLDVITSDSDFVSLCLARRLLGPDATIIGLDAEAPMPFPDAWLDGVFSLDAYHYMRSKMAVARELRRVVRPGGTWVFPHLHNAQGSNPTPGLPLSPEGYRRCFAGIDSRLFDESALLRRFMDTGDVDLAEPTPADQLAYADALCMVGVSGGDAAAASDLWRTHKALAAPYLAHRAGLGLSPLYKIEPGANGASTAHRAWASDHLQRECKAAEAYLPDRVEIKTELLQRIERRETRNTDAQAIEPLIRSFVLVPLPPRYRAPHRSRATIPPAPAGRSPPAPSTSPAG